MQVYRLFLKDVNGVASISASIDKISNTVIIRNNTDPSNHLTMDLISFNRFIDGVRSSEDFRQSYKSFLKVDIKDYVTENHLNAIEKLTDDTVGYFFQLVKNIIDANHFSREAYLSLILSSISSINIIIASRLVSSFRDTNIDMDMDFAIKSIFDCVYGNKLNWPKLDVFH